MALSILNFAAWEIPEARVPFLIADAVVIVALYYVDRGMKAEKELALMRAENDHQKSVTSKESKRAQQAKVREEKKQAMKQQKYTGNNSKKGQHNIQQPNKNKRN